MISFSIIFSRAYSCHIFVERTHCAYTGSPLHCPQSQCTPPLYYTVDGGGGGFCGWCQVIAVDCVVVVFTRIASDGPYR